AAVPARAALDLAVELGHDGVRVRAARERVPVCAVGGGEDVAVLHRLADADGGCLLPDRNVEEPRQLARAEALLDLLLDRADRELLAQDLAPGLRVQHPTLLDLCHGGAVYVLRREPCRRLAERAGAPAGGMEARRIAPRGPEPGDGRACGGAA